MLENELPLVSPVDEFVIYLNRPSFILLHPSLTFLDHLALGEQAIAVVLGSQCVELESHLLPLILVEVTLALRKLVVNQICYPRKRFGIVHTVQIEVQCALLVAPQRALESPHFSLLP